jgi:hypothetical protein
MPSLPGPGTRQKVSLVQFSSVAQRSPVVFLGEHFHSSSRAFGQQGVTSLFAHEASAAACAGMLLSSAVLGRQLSPSARVPFKMPRTPAELTIQLGMLRSQTAERSSSSVKVLNVVSGSKPVMGLLAMTSR